MIHYRVVLCSGANIDITAGHMRDDPARTDVICFYHDQAGLDLAARIQRDHVAALLFGPLANGEA